MGLSLAAVLVGFVLDLIFGDPAWMPHPIRLIGLMIEKGEKFLRKFTGKNHKGQYVAGMILSIFIILFSFAFSWFLIFLAAKINWGLGVLVEAIMCYQIFAVKSLKVESMKVYKMLALKDIIGARRMLSYIVGRDTENLNEEQIVKATVETVAENTADGVIGPLFFMLIGGAPLGFLYKAINTLDSMIGYKNDKYLYFGKFAAKLDDLANLAPSRLAAYLMIIASSICKYDMKGAYKIYKRDKYNHSSPNSGHTEAVCAGALGIQLGGSNFYFGKIVEKKTIGDPTRMISSMDIINVNKLLYWTSILGITLGTLIKAIVIY
jgi:adenosylcobinamide-phosphate synthase